MKWSRRDEWGRTFLTDGKVDRAYVDKIKDRSYSATVYGYGGETWPTLRDAKKWCEGIVRAISKTRTTHDQQSKRSTPR